MAKEKVLAALAVRSACHLCCDCNLCNGQVVMMLIVDTNEKATNPKVVAELEKNFSQVIIANLNSADINIPLDDGSVLAIERKTPSDFLSSISDGRLFHQAELMSKQAKYCAIIITGRFIYGDKDDMAYIKDEDGKVEKTNWRGSSVRASMIVLQYSSVPVIFCPPKKFCQTISELYNTVNKPDERQAVRKKRIITFPPVDEGVEFIAQIPGVGLKLAESLMLFAGKMEGKEDDYGSVATALHWLSILVQIDKAERPAGWGPAKILNARKFFGLDSNQYIAMPKEVTMKKKSKKGKEEEFTVIDIDGTLYQKYIPF